MKRHMRVALVGASMLLGSVLWVACPQTGVVCSSFLKPCGITCADVMNDPFNCGGCGLACQAGQVCNSGVCACEPGTVTCGAQCVVTSSDPNNCGGCAGNGGAVCTSGQVCENGHCQAACTLSGTNNCGGSCVDLTSDPNHCGSCTTVCAANESCHSGQCRYDVLAACTSVGSVVGVNATTLLRGANTPLGSLPVWLTSYQATLLDVDGTDSRLYQADLASLQQLTEAPHLGAGGDSPTQALVDGSYVYVVNSMSATLQVLKVTGQAVDAGEYVSAPLDGGLGLSTVAVLPLGTSTSPEYETKIGSTLYITLFGTSQLARVDVTNPAAPALLPAIDLHLADGGAGTEPSPWGVAAFQSKVYVALQNESAAFVPGAPMLAVVNPADAGAVAINLLGQPCAAPFLLAPSTDGTHLYVSCAGVVQNSGAPYYNATGVANGTVLSLNASNAPVAAWGCPAGGPDSGCNTFSPGALAVQGTRLFVGDNSYGRMLVLNAQGDSLTEVAGFSDGGVLPACPISVTTGNSNISSVLAVP